MKFGVVIFPGSNCDQDMIYTLETLMGQEVDELWHKDADLKGCDFIVLPGGFSFGDYLRSGAIARFSPIMKKVIEHCSNGGFAMGICNGFQILCEAGLLPGALLHNSDQKFICNNVHLKTVSNNSMVSSQIDASAVLKIPIAHGEGRYFIDDQGLKELEENDQIIFKYCNEEGEITRESNPNGSVQNIAGICNMQRNVFGMMPHPERAVDPLLKNTDGRVFFESILSLELAL